MNKKIKKISFVTVMSVLLFSGAIVVAFAAQNSGTSNATRGILSLIQDIQRIIGALIPAMMGLAVVAFFWGVILFLFTQKKEDGRSFMLWGIIALIVMSSVWGIVGLLRGTFFGGTGNNDYQNVNFGPPEISE